MRRVIGTFLRAAVAVVSVACTEYVTDVEEGVAPAAPTGLVYRLEPSGDPLRPAGLVLHWDLSFDPNIAAWNVYSRDSSGGGWGLRASTSSPSFHDDGIPHLEYYVTAEGQGGLESSPSASILVDERLRLPAPTSLVSISLDAAIHLQWSDNAYQSDPAGFWHYRVYSSSYDLDNNVCGTAWVLEGTTVAPVFLSGALVNGAPRCFATSAVTIEGFESLWSPLRYDTPRPDAMSQLVSTQAADLTHSGFRFFLDANNDGQVGPLELGIITLGTSQSVDFTVTTDASNNLLLTPVRINTDLRAYSNAVITSLTDIDIAPATGYSRTSLIAQPGRGYVFRMNENDGFYRYGAVRVVAVGPDYVIFDWSYQPDRGNPELLRAGITAR